MRLEAQCVCMDASADTPREEIMAGGSLVNCSDREVGGEVTCECRDGHEDLLGSSDGGGCVSRAARRYDHGGENGNFDLWRVGRKPLSLAGPAEVQKVGRGGLGASKKIQCGSPGQRRESRSPKSSSAPTKPLARTIATTRDHDF